MDIKFQVTKIIDNGSKIDDWTLFFDQLKRKKCDRDLLAQVLTIALNNSTEKMSKQYKKLLISLANLQSETSIDMARQTFEDAYNLDTDCAIVCVFYAQFEIRQNRKNEATSILRSGKMDGRVPKFLIKNAYRNLRDNKQNLFEGILDPWDDSLHDITATATIINNQHKSPAINKSIQCLNTHSSGARKKSLGKPTRSGSSILKESTPKNPTDQVKAKLGLIECSASKSDSKKDDFIFQPVRPASSEKSGDESENHYRPTLSPFFKESNTPMLKQNKKKAFETPQGFSYNIFESISKQQQAESKRGKESLNDIVASLDFVNTPPVKATEKSSFKDFPTIDLRPDKPTCTKPNGPSELLQENIEKALMVANEAMNQSKYFLSSLDKNNFKTPVNRISKRNLETSALQQRTCPKKVLPSGSTRNPLTEVKLLNSSKDLAFTRKQRLDFEVNPPQSSIKLGSKEIAKENIFNSGLKKKIPLNSLSTPVSKFALSEHPPGPMVSSGLTELIQSIDLLKEKKLIENPNVKLQNVNTKPPEKNKTLAQNNDKMLPKDKSDVDNLLQNAIEIFGMNGFNMDQRLDPVPTDTKFIKINGEPYTRVKKIARGGFCKVYEVANAEGSLFALKKVNLDELDSLMIECHMNEIKLLTQLKGNPFIIQLFGWEKTKESLLLLMEEGDLDLSKTLKKFDKVPIEKVKHYWEQMLKAVKVVHDLGIVHADLKPANFLFVGKALKLIDFGISNSLQIDKTSITRECMMGTLNYMPPEALMPDNSHADGASRISPASDVWSLGCILYLMIFRRTPYQHLMNSVKIQRAIRAGEVIKYEGIEDHDLLDCLQGCLKFNKRQRYTIQQLLQHPFVTGK